MDIQDFKDLIYGETTNAVRHEVIDPGVSGKSLKKISI
jgi:hypothetical protein